MAAKHTVLITGASAGLGEKFAELFAKDGFDLVLVARGEARLNELARRLREAHKISVEVMPADLSDPIAPQSLYDLCKTRGLVIDHLVNNAGFGSQGTFIELDMVNEAQIVEVNCTALLKMTHLFMKDMKARGFGRVMNIASTAGFQPGPFMATYFATKAFVESFTEAVAHEMLGSGVTVTAHCPGATATEFAMRAGNDKTVLFKRKSGIAEAGEVAAHGYRAMMRGDILAIHGAMNSFGVTVLRFAPRGWVRAVAAKFNSPPA
jgi:short-subunit dehydrogenase